MSKGRYHAYPEYKDSGLDWLGPIPNDWTLNHVKHIAPFQVGWTPPTKSDANFEGDNLWANISDLKSSIIYDTAKRVSNNAVRSASMRITPKGSLLYSFKLSVGIVSFAGNDMFTNEAIASFLDIAKLPLAYLFYALPEFVIKNASTNIYGANILNQELIRDAYLLAPPYGEAEQIAKFLDHETTKIDRLIEKQQALIALLKEKRQAVISHAVTKGLDPHAPLKDSGIEWLGQVPAHWEVIKGNWIGRLFGSEVITDSDIRDEGEIPFIKVSTLSNEGFELGHCDFFLTRLRARQLSPKSNYVVFPKRGAAIFTNKVNIVKTESIIDPNLMGWEIGPKALSEFVAYLLKLRGLKDIADVSTVPQINNKHIEPIKFPIPPRDEQIRIINYLATETDRFGNLISKAENAIELLQERRTALISAAVIGKIDVRAWQPVVGSKMETPTADAH